MRTHRLAARLSLLLLFALSALAFPQGAQAQLFAPGVYQGVETGTGNTFLLRMENPLFQAGVPLVVATLFNLDGGTYRVFAGRVDRGGLNIYFSSLCPALSQSAAAQVLTTPSSAFVTNAGGTLIVNTALIGNSGCCQLDQLGVGQLDYNCGQGHAGNLQLLRP